MRRAIALPLVLAGLVAHTGSATTRLVQPDVTSVSTTWSGWSEDGYVLFRLVLRTDGTGLLAYKAAQLVRCRIRHWSLKGTKLTGELVPTDDTGEALTIHGHAGLRKLTLVLTAKALSGTRRVPFTAFPESNTQEYSRELTEAMSHQP